jgi:hypothetical protein
MVAGGGGRLGWWLFGVGVCAGLSSMIASELIVRSNSAVSTLR